MADEDGGAIAAQMAGTQEHKVLLRALDRARRAFYKQLENNGCDPEYFKLDLKGYLLFAIDNSVGEIVAYNDYEAFTNSLKNKVK
jgi:hypothetical protein